jgi:hypothetical protein
MTQTEIKNKIADWESRLKNPSVASVPSAVAKINSEIADLKSKLETEKPTIKPSEKPKKEIVKILGKEVTVGTKEHEKLVAQKKHFDDLLKGETEQVETKKETPKKEEPSSKYKVGDILWHDTQHKGEYKKVKILAITGYTGDGHRYDIEFVDDKNKGINKFATSYDDKLTKNEPKINESKQSKEEKKQPYNCDDLIKEAEERHERAKKAAKERANAPKKSEATKGKEKIEKVHDTIEKQIEAGKFTKEQVKKLIAETKDLLKLLEKALNNL